MRAPAFLLKAFRVIRRSLSFFSLSLFSELCNAATKIQASFRGHMARKKVETVKAENGSDPKNEVCIELSGHAVYIS